MDKIEKLRELFGRIADIQDEKMEVIKHQRYTEAAELRDEEREVENQIDKLVGVSGYYRELVRMEEVNHHLEVIKSSLDKLKKLDFKMGAPFQIEIDAEALLELQQKHLKIQQDILNFRVNADLPEKKFDKKLAF